MIKACVGSGYHPYGFYLDSAKAIAFLLHSTILFTVLNICTRCDVRQSLTQKCPWAHAPRRLCALADTDNHPPPPIFLKCWFCPPCQFFLWRPGHHWIYNVNTPFNSSTCMVNNVSTSNLYGTHKAGTKKKLASPNFDHTMQVFSSALHRNLWRQENPNNLQHIAVNKLLLLQSMC